MQRPSTLEEAPPDVPMSDRPSSPRGDSSQLRCLLLIVTRDLRVSFANAAAKARLKVMRGDAFESIRHTFAITELADAIQRMCNDTHYTPSPLVVRHRDGTQFSCTLEPVYEDQRLSGVAVFLYPRLSSTECELDRLYAAMLDSLQQPVLAVDNEGRILYLNHAACTVLGFGGRELRGMQAQTVVTSEGEADEQSILKSVACGGEWRGQVMLRSKLGTQVCVMHAAPLRSPQGTVIGSVRTLELPELTYRPSLKRSRHPDSPQGSAASSHSASPVPNRQFEDQALLHQVREEGVSLVVVINPEGNVDWASDSKWFDSVHSGVTVSESIGKPATPFLVGRPVDITVTQFVEEALTQRQALEILVPQLPDEKYPATRNLHLSLMPIFNADGAVRHFIAKVRDIDLDRRASEEALASKLRLEFFNTLSHELKTPLNGIIGAGTLALRTIQTLSGSQTAEVRGNIETILSCAEVLSTLINNLIDYRKIEANKLELQRVPLDVRATFSGAVAQCEALAQQKSMRTSVTVDPAVPQYVAGDSLRLTQVTVNLVLNAIKYSPPGRRVNVNVSALMASGADTRLIVSVEDEGIGIAEDKLETLFQQRPETTESGAGLGLRICKKLVERMDGKIEVKSKLGEGTTFTFSAMVGLVSAAQASFLSRERNPPAADFRILVVEDNLLNQKILLRILQQLGYSADVAADGRQAIEMVAKHNYDLILMDIAMPVMNGLDATRYIARNWDEAHRPVIVGVTANAVTKELNEYINAGMTDCVTKPVTVAKVLSILQSARESESRRRKEARRGSY